MNDNRAPHGLRPGASGPLAHLSRAATKQIGSFAAIGVVSTAAYVGLYAALRNLLPAGRRQRRGARDHGCGKHRCEPAPDFRRSRSRRPRPSPRRGSGRPGRGPGHDLGVARHARRRRSAARPCDGDNRPRRRERGRDARSFPVAPPRHRAGFGRPPAGRTGPCIRYSLNVGKGHEDDRHRQTSIHAAHPAGGRPPQFLSAATSTKPSGFARSSSES
jgi:hypothetical protein